MRQYFVEVKYTVTERFRINAEYESDAKYKAKSGDFEPFESTKGPERVTASWPLADQPKK